MTRNRVTLAVGLAVALGAAYFAFKDINAQQLLNALASAQYGYVVPALLVTYSGYLVRTWRWQLMVAPVKRISIKTIFPLLVIGFAWNLLLPLRIGEVVRAHLLGQREGVSRTMLLATIVVERVLDGVAIMALLALVGGLTPNLPMWVADFTQVALMLFGVALVGLVMLIVSESFTLRWLMAITSRIPEAIGGRINILAQSFVRGYVALHSPSRLALIVFATFIGWFIEAASYAILLPAFGLRFNVPTFISASSFYAVILNLNTLIPAPGGGGTTEYFGTLALSVFGVEQATALSLTVVGHAIQLFVITTLGAWAVWREGFSLRRIEQVTAEVE